MQNFSQAIDGAANLKNVNMEVLGAVEQVLTAEEAEDTQLRTQHGAKFNRPPSATVNQQYKQSIFDYKGKMEMAQGTDAQIRSKYDGNQQGFQLLSKTRQELSAMIP